MSKNSDRLFISAIRLLDQRIMHLNGLATQPHSSRNTRLLSEQANVVDDVLESLYQALWSSEPSQHQLQSLAGKVRFMLERLPSYCQSAADKNHLTDEVEFDVEKIKRQSAALRSYTNLFLVDHPFSSLKRSQLKCFQEVSEGRQLTSNSIGFQLGLFALGAGVAAALTAYQLCQSSDEMTGLSLDM